MINFPGQANYERRTLKSLCALALACFVIIAAFVACQAVTGAMLAVRSAASMPEVAAERTAAASAFKGLSKCHSFVGFILPIPAFIVLTVSILFTLKVGFFKTRLTRFTWAQVTRAIFLCLLLVGISLGGTVFSISLRSSSFWLVGGADSAEHASGVTMKALSPTAFYTFLALHGIVLPFLVIISMIFMWPSFHEFLKAEGPALVTKWSAFEPGQEPAGTYEEDLPEGWASLSKMTERRKARDDEDETGAC